jgi:uncharacterized protein (DUF1778 family)
MYGFYPYGRLEECMANSTARQPKERIDVRLRADQKMYIERAASIKGLTTTDFIVQNAVEVAARTIREYESWTLERPDSERFVEALMNPPAPGAQLSAAAARYNERLVRR